MTQVADKKATTYAVLLQKDETLTEKAQQKWYTYTAETRLEALKKAEKEPWGDRVVHCMRMSDDKQWHDM